MIPAAQIRAIADEVTAQITMGCSQFCNVLPKRHRGRKPKHVPGALERALIEGDK